MADTSYIPFHRPSIGQEEIEAVTGVLTSKWLTTGPVALQFERAFASYIGSRYALAVNSGTAALQLALDAIGLRPGDEVLVPTYTFTATAEVVTYFGARPVLCDSVQGGFNIDVQDAARRVTERTRAIIPVHIAGESCELQALQALASKHNLHVIEDAAHALPATYHGQKIGTISEMTAFSFYATKALTTGEGGMLVTNDDAYAQRASTMRLHGIGGDAWKRYSRTGSWYYEVLQAGYKLNLCDVLAAIGVAQLGKCDEMYLRRERISAFYNQRFSAIAELEVPTVMPDSQHAWHLYILRIRPESLVITRNEFIEELKRRGIGTSVHFIPLHRHPFYADHYGYRSEKFPNADDAYERCLSLPLYPDMAEWEMEKVAAAVEEVVIRNLRVHSVSTAG